MHALRVHAVIVVMPAWQPGTRRFGPATPPPLGIKSGGIQLGWCLNRHGVITWADHMWALYVFGSTLTFHSVCRFLDVHIRPSCILRCGLSSGNFGACLHSTNQHCSDHYSDRGPLRFTGTSKCVILCHMSCDTMVEHTLYCRSDLTAAIKSYHSILCCSTTITGTSCSCYRCFGPHFDKVP